MNKGSFSQNYKYAGYNEELYFAKQFYSQASINITNRELDFIKFREVTIEADNILFSSAGANLNVRFFIEGGNTPQVDATYNLCFFGRTQTGADNATAGADQVHFVVAQTLSAAATFQTNVTLTLKEPGLVGSLKHLRWDVETWLNGNVQAFERGGGSYVGSTGRITGIQLYPGAGTIGATIYVSAKKSIF